jgi:hypothetical protein
MTNTPHTDCLHPSTSAARAKCRKDRAARKIQTHDAIWAILNSFYGSVGSCEEIGAAINDLAAKTQIASLNAAAMGYYDDSLDMDEVIGLVHQALTEI